MTKGQQKFEACRQYLATVYEFFRHTREATTYDPERVLKK